MAPRAATTASATRWTSRAPSPGTTPRVARCPRGQPPSTSSFFAAWRWPGEDGRAFAAGPHAGRQEGLQGNRHAVQGRTEGRRLDAGGDRLPDLLPRERLALGLEGEISHARSGRGERAFRAPGWARRKPHVEGLGVEIGLGALVARDVDEHDAIDSRRERPVTGLGLEHDATRRRLREAVGTRAEQSRRALGFAGELHHAEAGMGEHGEQHGVRLYQHELHGPGVARPDRLDHARNPAEQGRPHRAPRRSSRPRRSAAG